MAEAKSNPVPSTNNRTRVTTDLEAQAVYLGDIAYYDDNQDPDVPLRLTIRTPRETRRRGEFVEMKLGAHAYLINLADLQAALEAAGK